MDDARAESGSDEAIGRQAEEDCQIRSDALELASTAPLACRLGRWATLANSSEVTDFRSPS
jgi:hypothetical protein